MAGRRSTHWVLVALLAFGAWMGVEAFMPRQAAASCGDYVVIPGEDHPSMPRSGPTEPVKPTPCSQQGSVPGDPAKPCRGPFCGGEQSPPPAPPTVAPQRTQESACVWNEQVAAAEYRILVADPGAHGRPIHRSSFVFHPPRPI